MFTATIVGEDGEFTPVEGDYGVFVATIVEGGEIFTSHEIDSHDGVFTVTAVEKDDDGVFTATIVGDDGEFTTAVVEDDGMHIDGVLASHNGEFTTTTVGDDGVPIGYEIARHDGWVCPLPPYV